jgi:uncharacterized protein with FMN-binding domain
MKRVIASLFGTVTGLVMLLSFKTHSQSTGTIPAAVSTTTGDTGTGSTTTTGSGTSGTGSTGSGSSSTSSSSKSSSGTGSTKSGTYTGDSVNTQWGPVQVKITVTNGKVTSAAAVVYPNGNGRDQEINAYAVPTLNQEAVSASSAQIDMVSGATFTSTGYIQSLQSALDQAGL